VAQDQLEVSSGWVRCGRCDATFNALETLFEATGSTQPHPSAPPGGTGPAAESVHGQPSEAAPVHALTPVELNDRPVVTTGPAEPLEISAPSDPDPQPTPTIRASFLLGAADTPRKARPAARAAQITCAFLLAALLLLQVVFMGRDVIAARWPASQDLLGQACVVIGCRVEALRHTSDLTVETSELRKISDANRYRLAVTVRNRGSIPLMTPSFDLTLTDAQGGIVARRMISPGELGSSQPIVAARGELTLQAYLEASDPRVTGFTIEAFYP